jgi:ABC-type transport system involved in multi-copper enzyme maturation permease subunit
MTTTQFTASPTPTPAAARRTPQAALSDFGAVMQSEWTKLRTVRSTYWTAVFTALAVIGVAAVACAQWANTISQHRDRLSDLDPITTSLNGTFLGQLAIGTLGVLVISAEYGTGMISATLTAIPQRRTVLAAKALTFTAATLVFGQVVSFAAFGLGQAILSTQHAGASLADPGALRSTVGAGLYLTAVGLFGFGIGAAVRHTAGALATLLGLLFLPSALADLLPPSKHWVIEYMPANSGTQAFTANPHPPALAPWTGLGVFCLYVLASLIAAVVLTERRDAVLG